MNKTPKIIIGAGFGSSGLSAFMNLLEEVEGIYTTPQEFAMFNDPDGLISLESALIDNWSIFQGNVAIRRFKKLAKVLSKKYKCLLNRLVTYAALSNKNPFHIDLSKSVFDVLNNFILLTFTFINS